MHTKLCWLLLINNDIILLSKSGEVVKEGLKDCAHTLKNAPKVTRILDLLVALNLFIGMFHSVLVILVPGAQVMRKCKSPINLDDMNIHGATQNKCRLFFNVLLG